MNIIVRKILNYFAIIIFLIASCFLIFISFGYKYNFSKNKFEKTSVLYIKSYPRGAEIFMNGKRHKKSTPAQINYLKPDIYKIEVLKDKFQKWEKQITIRAEETVFLENISLFFDSPEKEIIKKGELKEISISPNKEILLFYDNQNEELNTFDIKSENISVIEKNLKNINYSLWSSDNQKILIKSDEKYFILFPYLNKSMLDLSNYINFNVKSFVWDKFKPELLYIVDLNGSVFKFNTLNNKLEKVELKDVLAIKPEGDKIFYIQRQKNQTIFGLLDRGKEQDDHFVSVPYSEKYEFLEAYKDYICLLDKNINRLYLIDPNLKDYLIKTFYNVNDVSWDLYNRSLLLRNNFEIWFYDVGLKKEEIINRVSSNIDIAFWHRNNNHVFYSVNQDLKIVEIDSRWGRNEFFIEKNFVSKYILANKRGNIFYYITIDGLEKNTIQ